MQDNDKKFEVKLPVRITGLVFWGLVFIGLLIAVFILEEAETRHVRDSRQETRNFAYQLEELIEQYPDPPVITNASGRIRSLAVDKLSEYGFHAVRLFEDDQELVIGPVAEDDDLYEYTLNYYPQGDTRLREVRLELYYINAKKAIADLRKKILLSIGFGVFIFGLFLQRVLQKMLSTPFQRMVETAEDFSKGNEDVRFDDSRQDEFGYLARFINDAIGSILSHQEELKTALERASESEIALSIEKEQAEVTLNSISDTVVSVDIDKKLLYVNPAGEKLLHVSNRDVGGMLFNDVFRIVNETSGELIGDSLQECFNTGEIVRLPEHSSLFINHSDLISIEASIAPMKNLDGDLIGAVIVVQDVSHTRRLTRQLSYNASHDLLTGLYNRRKFEEVLEEILINVKEEDRQHSLLYLDLDNFKIVNDTCGHVAGDELLKQLPSLINDVLRSGDVVARLGGDEFGIILENCGVKKAASIADKIRESIKDYRFTWDGTIFEIGVSVGVISINVDNCDMSEVMSSADIACYAAKDSGRNRIHVYEPSDEIVSERFGQMHWTARISRALEDDRFRIYQQPIVEVADQKCKHLEMLLRMVDEDGDIVPPGAFMPAAERYGLMPDIDRWVINAVFDYMRQSDAEQSGGLVYCINLSGDSINDSQLLDYILTRKASYGIELSNVCFEITETVAISNLSKATHVINELKEHGCQFALDDFGSGLSSFAYLKSLPVNYLKIDGGFVRDVSRDEIDRAMVESIQQIGKVMNLKTIAEHVEDELTLKILREIGVDYVQGYHLGRPTPVMESLAEVRNA